MQKLITSTFIITGLAFAAVAQNEEAINERHEVMEANGKDMKALSAMAKGETEFDAASANAMLGEINSGAKMLKDYFPEDSQTGMTAEGDETEAAPAIWEKPDEFAAALDKFVADTDAAVAANPQDAAQLGAAIQLFAGNCKSCHEDFRIKKD